MEKDALILGGAGFIGTHLARQLVDCGQFRQIVSLDIESPRRPIASVTYKTHDVRQPIHQTIDRGFDYVFNLAAVHRTPGHPDPAYYETNIAGALNAVAFCERHGIENLFFTSSISVYGPSEEALDESSPVQPNGAYGRSKYLAELIHRAWHERSLGRRLRIVRPAVVFGEGENGNYTLLVKLLRRGWFAYPGRTDTLKASGYVKELVRSMFFALDRPEPLYLYNFAGPQVPTIADICGAFHELGGMRPPLGIVPLPVVRSGALCCQALNALGLRNPINLNRVTKLIHSTNVLPRRLIADGYPFAYDLRSAISDWLATDEEVRPVSTRLRPVAVPAVRLRSIPEMRAASPMQAHGA
jgi:nucleoside-diphosphate-sugar epimerase